MKTVLRAAISAAGVTAALLAGSSARAGPETALREFAGGQVKKGVRTIGMGGDGATTGNYGLVWKDSGTTVVDQGIAHYLDTGNTFTFSAVGFTSPIFWKDAAFFVIALGQTGNGVRVWDYTAPDPKKPPSIGNLSDTSIFVKFAKPITPTLSAGVMLAFETSHATLVPDQGGAPIDYGTSWLPSGGFGVHWHPSWHWQVGARVVLNHDMETRKQGDVSTTGLLRSYEYRLGAAYSPWRGTLFDAGFVLLDRSNQVEHTMTLTPGPTVGVEQELVRGRVWVRAGLDETTWTTGLSVKVAPFKLDVAYLYDLGLERIGYQFGQRNVSLIATLVFHYASLFERR